jgi:peptidoglycan hydrolase-like protein with peptidoglycan-binding domain
MATPSSDSSQTSSAQTSSAQTSQPSPTSSTNSFTAPPVLYPWDVGPAIARMQELLCAHGFSLRVDGDFGWRTEAAVKVFQRRHGIRVDGIVGPETWGTLIATVKPGARLLRQGYSGADVYELQGLLQVNGYLIKRNGLFDSETKAAVITFQQQHHLRDDGLVDAVVWALLRGRKPVGRPPSNSLFSRFSKKRHSNG